jgi:hypothetical protein
VPAWKAAGHPVVRGEQPHRKAPARTAGRERARAAT